MTDATDKARAAYLTPAMAALVQWCGIAIAEQQRTNAVKATKGVETLAAAANESNAMSAALHARRAHPGYEYQPGQRRPATTRRRYEMSKLTTTFDNVEMVTVEFRGRRVWLARQVGRALGYSDDGKRIARNITADWSDEVRLGEHYEVLSGSDLADFKALVGAKTAPSKSNRAITVLYEPGLHLVLLLTKKATGKRLRKHLAEHVLPQLARDDSYSPDRKVDGDAIVDRDVKPANDTKSEAAQLADISLRDRMFQDRVLREAIEASSDYLDGRAVAGLQALRVEIATGRDVKALKPGIDDDELNPTQLGEVLGVSANRIGRTAGELGIRCNKEGICRVVQNARANGTGSCKQYLYSRKGQQMIHDRLVEQGYITAIWEPAA